MKTEKARTTGQMQSKAKQSVKTPSWSVPFLTRMRRRSRMFFWQYRAAAKIGRALTQQMSSGNIPLIDPWKGDARQGQPLATGIAPLAMLDDDWHDFHWLRDMREYGGQHARTHARRYLLEWLSRHNQWDQAIWHPMRLSSRIKSLILTWNWFGQSASESQQMQFLTSLVMQSSCLAQDLPRISSADHRIEALSALLLDHVFQQSDADISSLTRSLFAAVDKVILPDGCHASRRPDRHITCLKTLHEIRYALGMAQQRKHDQHDDHEQHSHSNAKANLARANLVRADLVRLDAVINLMGAVGRMWRLGDHELIAMRQGLNASQPQTDHILDKSGPRGKICQHADHGGYIRLASGRSVAVLNAGPSRDHLHQQMEAGGEVDAAANALEFSFQKQRILISGGYHYELSLSHPNLAELMQGTSAHSTLSIDMINSSQIDSVDQYHRGQNIRQASMTMAEVGPASGGLLGVASHDGYLNLFGLIHERKVFLTTGGQSLKGQDILRYTGEPGNIPTEATLRFHLHPRINASKTNNSTVLLKLPGSMASWKFVSKNGTVSIEDSITAINGKPQRCQQIVITVALTSIREHMEIDVSWGFMKQSKLTP